MPDDGRARFRDRFRARDRRFMSQVDQARSSMPPDFSDRLEAGESLLEVAPVRATEFRDGHPWHASRGWIALTDWRALLAMQRHDLQGNELLLEDDIEFPLIVACDPVEPGIMLSYLTPDQELDGRSLHLHSRDPDNERTLLRLLGSWQNFATRRADLTAEFRGAVAQRLGEHELLTDCLAVAVNGDFGIIGLTDSRILWMSEDTLVARSRRSAKVNAQGVLGEVELELTSSAGHVDCLHVTPLHPGDRWLVESFRRSLA